MLKPFLRPFVQNKFILPLIFVGTIVWSLTMVKSGPYTGFWGANGHDGVWHIALANSLARGSLEMPTFAGEQLQNYHIGYDLILALLHILTGISVSALYFQILPVATALGIGIATYLLILRWTKSTTAATLSVFFVYFSNSLGWVFGRGESMFWAMQSPSTLINPPFALSLLIILLGMVLLQRNKQILAGIFFGTLIFIKAYAGALILASLFVVIAWQILSKQKENFIKTFLVTGVVFAFLFLPFNSGSTSLFSFQPFWLLESMMAASDRVGWSQMAEAMLSYKQASVISKFSIAYGVSLAIFVLGNVGVRILSGVYFIAKIRKIDWIGIFLLTIACLGLIVSMTFVQEGTAWNIVQFFYYSLFALSILAGIGTAIIFDNKKTNKFIKVLIALSITVSTVFSLQNSLSAYLPSRPPAKLSDAELEALEFLSQQPSGVVLTYPYDAALAKEAESNPPRPLYLYESTAYVSAFADKPVFLEDEVNLNIMNYDWKNRREEVEEFYKTLDQQKAYNFLRDNNIKYVYWVKPQRATLGETQLGIRKIFENSEVDIFVTI